MERSELSRIIKENCDATLGSPWGGLITALISIIEKDNKAAFERGRVEGMKEAANKPVVVE